MYLFQKIGLNLILIGFYNFQNRKPIYFITVFKTYTLSSFIYMLRHRFIFLPPVTLPNLFADFFKLLRKCPKTGFYLVIFPSVHYCFNFEILLAVFLGYLSKLKTPCQNISYLFLLKCVFLHYHSNGHRSPH